MKNRFFSQEMASSSPHNNSILLATLLEWYKIRDTFFGDNYVSQNIPFALELASSCQHPDARWLIEACAGNDLNTVEHPQKVFSALGDNDARALCFEWLCGDRGDLAPLLVSAELGYAFAQGLKVGWTGGLERFKFAKLAAAQGERLGYYLLADCFLGGDVCERNLDKAKENLLLGSELGHVSVMLFLGWLLDESDPQRWRWWGRAAALGNSWSFLSNFSNQVEVFNSDSGSAAVMFAIGQALQEHVSEGERKIFCSDYNFDSRIGPAKQAIAFYKAQIKATKYAMRAWTQVGIKFNIVEDVRKLIAKLIWDAREETFFEV
jgi:TPR repeat protein